MVAMRFPFRFPFLAATVLIAGTTACGMLHVKEQQAKIDAFCVLGGSVEAERRDASPLVVVLARQTGTSRGPAVGSFSPAPAPMAWSLSRISTAT
jgi:hypothetical protein